MDSDDDRLVCSQTVYNYEQKIESQNDNYEMYFDEEPACSKVELNPVHQAIYSDVSGDEIEERFGKPLGDAEMKDWSKKMVPETTEKTVAWACRLFERWRKWRNAKIRRGQTSGNQLSFITRELDFLNDDELSYCLSRFVVEARKEDGSEYPPKTLRQLILLIQMHLNNIGRPVKFLSDPIFIELRNTLDNTMKFGAIKGNGMITKQASVISIEEEKIMWVRGILGDSNPQTLLDTILYLFGLNFALRSGDEHRNLTLDQLVIGENEQGKYIKYTEKISKTNQRGLKEINVVPKCVTAYENERPERCVVKLFQRYLELRPEKAPPMVYLRPLSKPTDSLWYSVTPVGKNTLAKTVQRLCQAAGFTGFYTNHSLRATCATRLFRCGVDEQLIAKTTGHRSNAIRQYKRPDLKQEAMVSSIVQAQKKPLKRLSYGSSPDDYQPDSKRKTFNVTLNFNM